MSEEQTVYEATDVFWKYFVFLVGIVFFGFSLTFPEGSLQQMASMLMGIFLIIVGIYSFLRVR